MIIHYLQSFIAGLLISLTGSIPLGNLNIAAMQIAATNTYRAFWFAVGVVLVEMAYLAVTLSLLGTFNVGSKQLFYFRLASVALLLIMAIASFTSKKKQQQKKITAATSAKTIVLGIVMSAVNPMQIPFWVGWVMYLTSHSLFVNTNTGHTVFVISAGIGTLIALIIFIFVGSRFSVLMYRHQQLVNRLFGVIFVLLAISQIMQLF